MALGELLDEVDRWGAGWSVAKTHRHVIDSGAEWHVSPGCVIAEWRMIGKLSSQALVEREYPIIDVASGWFVQLQQ